MATKHLFRLNSDLFVTFKTTDTESLSFSVRLRNLVHFVAWGFLTVFLLLIGTLLFFREMEISRKLEERLLKLEIAKLLVPVAPPAPVAALATTLAKTEPASTKSESLFVLPRLQEFFTRCEGGTCTVHFELVPSQTGVVQGELLLILETEVPRIGGTSAGNANTIRKHFLFYPKNNEADEMPDDAELVTLTKKPFRFAKALQSTAEFTVSETLRPLAASIYLYDHDGKLIHHDRKDVEGESTHAP